MAFWRNSLRNHRPNFDGETPNDNPASDVGAGTAGGDPNGVQITGERGMSGPLPILAASPWAGWPSTWSTPDWSSQLGTHKLIDVAWAAIDLNASVLSSFPPYRLRNGRVLSPPAFLTNPDDTVYASWAEFCKQLFWDFQLGEAFVYSIADGADGYPIRFRVVPPWLVNVELRNGSRVYTLGGKNVTSQMLHIRNISNTADAHGHGPLEVAGARMVTAGLLERYAHNLAETGGIPLSWLTVERTLTKEQADDLLEQWITSRAERAGHPALLSGGTQLNQGQAMSARDMTLLELAQFTEARIAVLCGVPPFLLGLPMAQGESLTYSNASSLFDYHDRSSLRPKANAVMEALSGWLLPRGQSVELNRDEYSRPDYFARAQANKIYLEAGVLAREEVRAMERFDGVPWAASAITGAELTAMSTPTVTPPPTPAAARPAAAPPREGT